MGESPTVSAVLTSAAVGVQLVLAAVLVVLALRALARTRARRMGFLALAFVAFLAQGTIVAVAIFTTGLTLQTATGWGMLLNAFALAVIYLGVLRP